MSLKLRPYQEEIVNNTRELMLKGQKNILIRSATGSGKTALTVDMLGKAAKKGKRSFFCVHRRELINQSSQAFVKANVHHGIISSGFKETRDNLISIASIPSLGHRLHKYPSPDLIVWDECHHIAAGTWSKIYDAYPNAFHIGLTATPERLDGRGLSDHFQNMVEGPSVKYLIDNDYLADYKLYMPSNIDLTGVKRSMGDYNRSQLNDILDKPTIIGKAVNEYKKYAANKRAVVFCASVKHSEHTVAAFNVSGIPAKHLDGKTPTAERDYAIRQFANGTIKILSNVDLFSEGFDVPAMEAVILLRPTQSLALYLQQIGRVLRYIPGKTAIILDHVGNVLRHGLPDEDRVWSLNGREKNTKQQIGPSIRVCKNCFAAQLPGSTSCKYCNCEFEIQSREIDEQDGELTEVNPELLKWKKKRARQQQGMAQTKQDLVELAKNRGYKNPHGWAHMIFQARQRKKLGRSS